MPRVHVFAVDWLPTLDDVANGGGLRSLQIVEALRRLGHEVTVSVPSASRSVRARLRDDPSLARTQLLHDETNQLDLLREVRPEIVFWLWPSLRTIPFSRAGDMLHVCDLNGLQHHEIANGSAALLAHSRKTLLQRCAGADLILTGSEEQNGYWLAHLERDGTTIPTAVVPYSLPATFRRPQVKEPARRLSHLHFAGSLNSWSSSALWLQRVANWCAKRGDVELSIIAGINPGGTTSLESIAALQALRHNPAVRFAGETTLRDVLAGYAAGGLALDLYDDTPERRLAVPIRMVNALLHGMPILTNLSGGLAERLVAGGAAVHAGRPGEDRLEACLDEIAGYSAATFETLSRSARVFANRGFDEAAATASLNNALQTTQRAATRTTRRWSAAAPGPRLGHVLVLSHESPNIRDLRVDLPLGALHRERLIEGYTVFSHGNIKFSTRAASAEPLFDAIWVQRTLPPDVTLALGMLQRDFLFDIDDNLLVSPSYRDAFSPESMQAARNLVRRAASLSTSTARLAELLQRHAYTGLLDKITVCPNLTAEPPRPPIPGPPRALIWASSDTPALIGGLTAVVRAIRDYCLANQLRVVCIGAEPPALLRESAVEIEHVGLIPYAAYLAQLRALAPAIIVCPLDTGVDPLTQDFIDGKSDIKILEALSTGVTGVFSAAKPYRDSDLGTPILADNDYRGWFEALERADRACRAGAPASLPPHRIAAGTGLRPWYEALARVQLHDRLHLRELTTALSMTRARLSPRLLSEMEFDPQWYTAENSDVRDALAAGRVQTAYEHYLSNGYRERRPGSPNDQLDRASSDQFWLNLQHTIDDMRQAMINRAPEIEDLRTRRAQRRRAPRLSA